MESPLKQQKSAKLLSNGGKLKITVKQGQLYRDVESGLKGKMDPYVTIEYQG